MKYTPQGINIKIGEYAAFKAVRHAVAQINSDLCINCGTCRTACPTEAISERQRIICRICPDCTTGPQFFPDQSIAYATEHACSIACPLGLIPEGYVNKIADGKFDEAYDLIMELNPLPGICGRICSHPCMDDCKRGLLIDEPIDIRGLKRFVADRKHSSIKPFIQKFDERVAVIGAGPAGIMAAFDLSKKGYKVKIFEAGPEPGGMMNKGIPSFRLDKDVLASEIDALIKAGIEIVYNTPVGKNPSINGLFESGYKAVVVAVGASKGMILPIEGSDADTVYDAVSLMKRINKEIPQTANATNRGISYGNAVIIGGGSVALDTARALLRKGAVSATCVCIEDDKTMPAMPSEISEAAEEGVVFSTCATPTRILTEWTKVLGVEFKKVSSIECDACGRLKPVTVDGSEFTLDADTVVFATGQKPDLRYIAEGAGLELSEAGLLAFDDENLMTRKEGMFLAGDTVTGKGSVIDALASGRKAALGVDNLLRSRGLTQRIEHSLTVADISEKIFPVMLEKLEPQVMPMRADRSTFEEIELGYSERQAVLEAKRCMKCGFEMVDKEQCIGCGACVGLCPQNAITMIAPIQPEVK
ncbi:MAG: FAD-dependent oxidoreductase [Spirochaetales bacterium]|nr:FAD-dependent oxidoreductase [Spirochaetales bacterium]